MKGRGITIDTPKNYIVDLAAYNAGTLLGIWIDATEEPCEFQAKVQVMLSESPELVAEEWRIDGYQGFDGVDIFANY